MTKGRTFISELKRRNVLRAGVLYIGAVWALAQGISQLGPSFGAPEWLVRWFVAAAAIGFPFWLLFAWFYEWTPQGFKLEHDLEPGETIAPRRGRKLDFAIIGVLAIAVVLLLTDRFVAHRHSDAAVQDKSVAVLPLANESGDASQQYFSDGLSEDFITALSQFDGLKVIGRNSSFQFRDSKDDPKTIGAKLGVAHLLEGSVRRANDMVRVSAELIRAADGSTVWSQRYDRPYKDLFALQDEITQSVASELKGKLFSEGGAVIQSDRPASGNLEAYSAYLQGNFHVAVDDETNWRAGIAAYERAVRLDPHYVQAWAALSFAQTNLAGEFLGGAAAHEALAAARRAAETALRLDANSAAAHDALGTLHYWGDLDWAGAATEFARALQLSPNSPRAQEHFAWTLATRGEVAPAIELMRKAIALDTLNADPYNYLASYLTWTGRLDEAEYTAHKALELQPASQFAATVLARTLLSKGEVAEARAIAAKLPQEPITDSLKIFVEQAPGGDPLVADAALKIFVERNAESAAFQIAEAYAQRMDSEQVFYWLDRAWANRDSGVSFLLFDPFFERYRHDARFAKFCRMAGLPALPADSKPVSY